MKGISLPRRAGYALSRRPARSLIIFLIMVVIFTALVAQAGVRTTMSTMREAIDANLGAGFTATSPAGALTAENAEKLTQIPGVKEHVYEGETLGRPQNAHPVENTGSVQLDPEFAGDIAITGTTNSELYPEFTGRIYRLTAGSAVTKEKTGALIHQEFATQNNLQIGSELILQQGEKIVRIPVQGIFSGKAENPTGLPAGASENKVFLDFASYRQLSGVDTYTLARYFTADASTLPAILEKARQELPDLQLEDNSAQFSGILESISGVEKMLSYLLIGFCLASAAILGLVLIFWARGRIREIGILLALGKSKLNILAQFIIEIALLGALSALLALLIGHFLSSSLSTALLARSGDATLAALSAESGGILSTLAALAGGYSIIFISLSAALFPIFRKTPKSILSQMS